jgi:hypothetical protein
VLHTQVSMGEGRAEVAAAEVVVVAAALSVQD